ncbi:MAG: replication-relaxation family protein [Aggregatilineales bacterium]
MRLTDRDKEAVEAIYRYRVLTQAQLEQLVYHSCHPSVAQHRLSLLYHHGYLARQFLPVRGGMVTSPILYLLDQKGADLLKREWGAEQVKWTPAQRNVTSLFFFHTLALNDVRIAITCACRACGYRVVNWTGESAIKATYESVTVQTASGRAERIPILPDGYFAVVDVHNDPKSAAHFFVELDRGTETTKRFGRKIRAYIAYLNSGRYTARYGTKSLRVLTVTEGKRRLKHLKQVTEAAGGKSRFWFTTLNVLTEETALTHPIWQVAGRTEPCSLIDSSGKKRGRRLTGNPMGVLFTLCASR